MTRRYFLCNGSVYEDNEFSEFLINYIHKNKLYNLSRLCGRYDIKDKEILVIKNVRVHPIRLAREIFGFCETWLAKTN